MRGSLVGYCTICGRRLSAKTSVTHSIGPTCAKKIADYGLKLNQLELFEDKEDHDVIYQENNGKM